MAKRSDFRQKLLDDIRLRKERMGIAQSSQAPADKIYGNSGRSFQGSGEATINKFSSSNTLNTEVTKMWLGTRQYKASAHEGTSQDIVQFGARRVEQNIDVSMALALALSNTGKLQNIELIMQYASPNLGVMNGRAVSERTRFQADGIPFLSNLQLGEVSKSVQKLNKILDNSSSGLPLGRDAIDIGRQLLRGAMDLEDSLRMLVAIQEASDHMVGSNERQVRLLKGKEEDTLITNKMADKRQMNRPRFSFDWSAKSKHWRELGMEEEDNAVLEQMISRSNSGKNTPNASLQLIKHRRSLSSGPGTKAEIQVSNTMKKSQSQEIFPNLNGNSSSSSNKLGSKVGPTVEKVRIPNVVARLMGLEEFPMPKKEAEMQKIKTQANDNKDNKMPKVYMRELDKGKLMTLGAEVNKQEVYKATNSDKFVNKKINENKILLRGMTETKAAKASEVGPKNGRTGTKDQNNMENKPPASNHLLNLHLHSKLNNQLDMNSMNPRKETEAVQKKKEKEKEKTELNEQKFVEKSERRVHEVEHDLPRDLALPYSHKESAQRKKNSIATDQRNAQQGWLVSSKQTNIMQHNASRQQNEYRKETQQSNQNNKLEWAIENPGNLKPKNMEENSDEASTKLSDSLTFGAGNRSLMKEASKEQRKEHQKNIQQERDRVKARTPDYHKEERKFEKGKLKDRRPLKTDTRKNHEKTKSPIQTAELRKSVHIPSAQREDGAQLVANRNENTIALNEDTTRSKILEAKVQKIKQQSSVSQEPELRLKETNKKAVGEKFIVQARNRENLLKQKAASLSLSASPLIDDSRKSRATNNGAVAEPSSGLSLSNSIQQFPDISDQEQFPISDKEDIGVPSFNPMANDFHGLDSKTLHSDFEHMKWKEKELSEKIGAQAVTENIDTFKKTLISTQHFLNAAQALFKVEIPASILQASKNTFPGENSKLTLDCVYELMRQKNRREGIIFAMGLSFAPVKERCMDDLIQELNDDIKSLKLSLNKDHDCYDTAEFLHKMLERDIQNYNPDINSSWDFGWTRKLLAEAEKEEVVRDVEKHVLNGLINELTLDFMNIGITIL